MKILGENSRIYNALQTKYMLEAYGGIKEILVMQRQKYFVDNYERTLTEMQRSTIGQNVASESPAYVIETMCVMGIISAVGIRISGMENATAYIPSLASFAMAAFRIMPSLGRITSAINNLMYNYSSLNAAYDNLHEVNMAEKNNARERKNIKEKQTKKNKSINFYDKMQIKNISWKYENTERFVISKLSITISKGESVGIIGTSGAGKSTLMDIILGLLKPQEGEVLVDNVDVFAIPSLWAKMVGYVPQTVYLMDDSIRNNIAFGIEEEKISDEKIWSVLKSAQIDQFVKNLPQGLDTYVGERGVRFSGGQRQRIAIARALYYDPQIIVFDEATSALDNDTEGAVMQSIENLRGVKTTIIVAHRLSTITGCDRIYEIRDGVAIEKNKIDIFQR